VGKDNAYYIRVLDDIGYAYDRLHRYSEALPIWKELVAISEIHNGPDHEFTIDFMQYLSSTYDGLGRYAEADAIGNRALAILEQKKRSSYNIANVLFNIAVRYIDTGRSDEAEPLLRRAYSLLDKAKPSENPHIWKNGTLEKLAWAYLNLKRYD